MFLNAKQEKKFQDWAKKTYGRELSVLEAQQVGVRWRPFFFTSMEEKKSLQKIKVDEDFNPRKVIRKEIDEIKKEESKARIEKAKKWLSHQDPEVFSKSMDKKIVHKRKEAALFLRNNLGLQYDEIAEAMGISKSGAMWICTKTRA